MSDVTLPVEDTPLEDTPRSAFGVLQHRVTIATVAILLALAGISWWSTVGSSRTMSSMVQGFAHVGRAMPFDMSAFVFLGMWTTMMVAMMFPTVGPMVLMHHMIVRRRGEGVTPTVAFAGGYLLVWAAVGLVPLAALIGFRHIADTSTWIDRAGGGVLLIAGAYQFTSWKQVCLRACRSPMTFLMTHDFGSGSRGALRAGISHGLYCLGCCWALMAVLFVVGLMNLAWMAGIAIVFLAEKNWRYGTALTRVIGVAVAVVGAVILVHPALLGSIAPASGGSMTMDG